MVYWYRRLRNIPSSILAFRSHPFLMVELFLKIEKILFFCAASPAFPAFPAFLAPPPSQYLAKFCYSDCASKQNTFSCRTPSQRSRAPRLRHGLLCLRDKAWRWQSSQQAYEKVELCRALAPHACECKPARFVSDQWCQAFAKGTYDVFDHPPTATLAGKVEVYNPCIKVVCVPLEVVIWGDMENTLKQKSRCRCALRLHVHLQESKLLVQPAIKPRITFFNGG